MLTLLLHPPNLDDPHHWTPALTLDRWENGDSHVTPYLHPCLETGMVLGPGRAFLVNRERVRGATGWCSSETATVCHVTPDEYQRRLTEARAWPLGFVIVEFTPGRVQVTASAWGVAPVHLTSTGGMLRGSWDLLDLVPHVDTRRLDPPSVVRFLTYANYYSSATLLADVTTVTERATATYTGDGLGIAYPEPGLHALPRELKPDADPVEVFERVLHGVISRWEFDPDRAAVDVSGGMDSANVALALAQLHPGRIGTGGMLLAGSMGEQQRRRRRALVASGFRIDHTVAMLDHLPFSPGGRRRSGAPFDPMEGAFAEARDVLVGAYADGGKRVLFTGLGGDEAMKLRSAERELWGVGGRSPLRLRDGAPAFLGSRGRRLVPHQFDGVAPLGPTLWSILECFSAFYPQHMRHGIWPINPFAAPEIVRLAESLPSAWRVGKRLLRERLGRAGFSQDVTHPRSPENFQHILDTAMIRHGVGHLTDILDRGALLVGDGYLDEFELRRSARGFQAAGKRTFDVYRPLMLESALVSLQAG